MSGEFPSPQNEPKEPQSEGMIDTVKQMKEKYRLHLEEIENKINTLKEQLKAALESRELLMVSGGKDDDNYDLQALNHQIKIDELSHRIKSLEAEILKCGDMKEKLVEAIARCQEEETNFLKKEFGENTEKLNTGDDSSSNQLQ